MKKISKIAALMLLVGMVACQNTSIDTSKTPQNPDLEDKHYLQSVTVDMQLSDQHTGLEFSVFQFDCGVLKSIAENVAVNDDGTITLDLDASQKGVLYLVSRDISHFGEEFTQIGTTTLEAFEKWSVRHDYADAGAVIPTILTKKISIAQLVETMQPIAPDNSTAKINLHISDKISVTMMQIVGLSDTFSPFSEAGSGPVTQDMVVDIDLGVDYTSTIYDLLRVFAQSYAKPITARVLVQHENGAMAYLEAELPLEIVGNRQYTIIVNSNGASLSTSLDTEDWDEENSSGTDHYGNAVVVDQSSVQLPQGVVISDGGKRIDAPYRGASFDFSLTNADVIASVGTFDDNITITPKGDNHYNLAVNRAAPDGSIPSPAIIRVLKIVDGVEYLDQIEVLTAQNPMMLSGEITKYHNGEWEYDAKTHIDGDFATITLPADYSVEWSSGEWFRAQTTSNDGGNTTVFTGGWRPNDTNANGQQEQTIVRVTTPDGITDNYTFTRRRYAIPTIYFNGQHWTKFNVRGNPHSYPDQIQVGSKYDQIEDLYEYLKTCSSADFIEIAGDAYLGANTTVPLKFGKKPDGEGFGYPEYLQVSDRQIIAQKEAGHSCPGGFSRPTPDQYTTVIWNQATFGTTTFLQGNELTHAVVTTQVGGHRVQITAYRNDAFAHEGGVGSVMFLKVASQTTNNQIVFPGYGTQWDNNWSLTRRYALFAMYAPGATSMFNNNYDQDNKLRIVHTGQAAVHSYQVRCVKNDDAFIIE